jgi:glycosyltransferase involved in cell wall biosynthesis
MPSTDQFELSVIIASYNRHDLLLRCLEHLSRQTQDPATFEVVIADDGSTDGSADMAEALETPFGLKVLRLETNSGQCVAQRAAVNAAVGRILLLLDDDVVPSPALVAAHIEGNRDDPQALCIGPLTQRPPNRRDWYAEAFARAWNHHYAELATREARWNDCYGGNLSFARSKVSEIGGLPIGYPRTFDFDLSLRLCRTGCIPKFLPDAHGVHDDQKGRHRLMQDARELGGAYVELTRHFPEIEPVVLRWSRAIGPRELVLRRILLALHVPAEPLARLGPLIPGESRKGLWRQIVGRLELWRSAREQLTADEWERILHDPPAGLGEEGPKEQWT